MVNNVERHTSGRSEDEAAVIKERAGESLQAERKIQQDVLPAQSTASSGNRNHIARNAKAPESGAFSLLHGADGETRTLTPCGART